MQMRNHGVVELGQRSLSRAAAHPEATLQVLAAAGRVSVRTVDVVAVVEVFIIEGRTG